MARLFEEYKKHKEGSDSTGPSSTSSLYEKYKNRGQETAPTQDFKTEYLSGLKDSDALSGYTSVMQNADFAEKSQYIPKDQNWLQKRLNGPLDALSESINGNPTGLQSISEKIETSFLTPNEKALFNYFYNTGDNASAFNLYQDLVNETYKRNTEYQKLSAQGRLDGGRIAGESLASIPSNVYGGIVQGIGGLGGALVGALSNGAEGAAEGWSQAAVQNPYSAYANAVRGASTEKIAEASGNNFAPFLYQTGMSVGDSLLTALLSGGVGETAALFALGGSAAQQKTMEVLENGGTAQEAALSGITSGLIEGLTEKVSLGHLTKILKGNAVKGGFRELAKRLAKNMLEEAGEEATSELANALTDAIILDWTNNIGTESDLKKFYDEQIANGDSEAIATGKTIGELVKNTLVSSAGGALGALMSGVLTTGIKTLSDYRAGKTIKEYGRTQDIADLARKEGREDIAQMIEKNPSNLNVGYAQDALAQEAVDVIRDKKATFEDKVKGIERLTELNKKSSPITGIADKKGKMLHPTAIKWENGSPVFVTEEGTYKAADVKVTDSASKLINLTEDIPEQARQTFIDNYNGENLGDYVNKFETAYELGKMDWQDDLTKMVTDGLLTEDQMKNIYAAAQKDETSETKKLENLKKNLEDKKKLIPDKKLRVKIDTSSIDLTKLNDNQRHNVTYGMALAKALGFNLTFFDSTKETGDKAHINGSYDASNNTISIDVNATNTETHNKGYTNAITTTLSHEITHWAKTNAPGIYKAFQDAMLKALAENSGQESTTIGEYVDVNKVRYPGYSDEEVADELVARACENMLQNSEFAKEALVRMTQEERKTLKDKIVEFFNKIRLAIKEIMGRTDSKSREYELLTNDMERLGELQKMWDDLIREAASNSAWADTDISDAIKNGVLLNGSETNNFLLSEKTYDEGGREFLQKWLDKQKDLTKNEKKAILDSMEQVYDTVQKLKEGYQSYSNWAEAGAELRGEDGEISVVVNNGEYALNIDFTTVCKKREVLNRVLNELVKSGDLNIYTLTKTDVNKINQIIKENGFEIACALCFVDAKRYKVGEWARSFEETYNDIIYQLAGANGKTADEFNYTNRVLDNPTEALISDTENVDLSVLDQIIKENTGKKNKLNAKGTLAKAIKENKSLWHKINASEIISSVGLDEIRMKNKELYKLVNGWEGSAKPKLSHGKVPYQNDILQNGKFNPKSAFKVGGVRIQSFSDFVPTMIFDYVQMVSELQAKGLPAHAYTKELTFAKLFGLTGIKINLSAIAKGKPIKAEWYDSKGNIKEEYRDLYARANAYVGLKTNEEGYPVDANGNVITTNFNLTADELKRAVYETDDESIDLEEAIKLQNTPGYDKNVGIIFVGASNNAIRKMLDDPDIPMIIPYHKSGINPVVAHLRNIASYTDYTNTQNTMYADGKKIDRKDLKGKQKEYYDSLDWYTLLDKNKGDAKKAAAEYIRLCEKKGWRPKFDEFKDHPNYYKLLEDFRMYDSKGKASPQAAVKLTNGLDQNGKAVLNMPTNEEFIKALEGDEKTGGLKKYDKSVSDLENGKLDKILKEVRTELQKVQYSRKYDVSEISEETNREIIEHFGTTTDYNVAGYMLKDGRMLDFSGRHWGDTTSKSRQVDHREIAEVLPSEDNGFDAMVNMISNGNIRLMPEVGGINLSIMPTDKQFEELKKYIRYHLTHGDREVTVDFDEVGGDTVYSRHFDSKANPEHILIEIANYFRNGARVSDLMNFHAQFSTKEDSEYKQLVKSNPEEARKVLDAAAKQWGAFEADPDAYMGKDKMIFFHGTYSDNFTVFDKSLTGTSSGDSGFFGRGFYFAYTKGEARTYGSNVMQAYLKIQKPFDFTKELYSYDGSEDYNDARDSIFISNFVKRFPELAKDKSNDFYVRINGNQKKISLAEYAKMFDEAYKNLKFNYSNYFDEYENRMVYNVSVSDPNVKYPLKILSTVDEAQSKNRTVLTEKYLKKYAFEWMDLPSPKEIVMNNDFSDAVKALGYDGIIQSKYGDEAVVFDENQIKSADLVTYDDKGNVIPLSERFTEKPDIRYSRKEDSEGKELSKDQVEFFKNSKARDAEGHLIELYHGTTQFGFAVFDPKKSDDKISLFFTDNKKVAMSYSNYDFLGFTPTSDETIDVTSETVMPDPKAKRISDVNTAIDILKKFGIKTDVREETGYGRTYEKFSTYDSAHKKHYSDMSKKDFLDYANSVAKHSGDNRKIYRVYLNLVNPLIVEGNGRTWSTLKYEELKEYNDVPWEGSNTRTITEYAKENGYDGVIFKNIYDSGIGAAKRSELRNQTSNVYVAFESNQVKSVGNLHPTENLDIRYSEKDNTSIKEQIKTSKELLDSNGVKASLVVPKSALTDKRSAEEFGINELKKYGTKVDTIDYGTIYFDDIGEIERYANNEIEKLAVGLIPKVLKKGIKVGEHGDHKNRQVETFTIAAKVTINDIPGYMGVTVKRTKNRTHAFRILFNDNLLKVWKELKKDAEGEYEKGSHHKGSLANSAVSASVDKLTLNAEKVNEENVNNEVFSYKDNDGYLHLDADDVLSLDDFEDYLNRVIGRNKRIEAHLRRLNVEIKDNVILNNTKLYQFAKIVKEQYNVNETIKSIAEELSKAYLKVTDIEAFDKAAESVAKKYAKTDEEVKALISDIREASWRISDNLTMAEKYDEAMKELRERLKHAKEEVREDAQRRRLIQKIVEREDKLITMLRKNDKENHIPDVLKAPLKALLDLVDVQAYVSTEAMANNFNALANALQNVSADYADPEAMDNALKDLTLYFDSNGYFVQNVKDIAAEVQAKVGNALGTTKHNSSILDLSMDSLKKLNEALVAISHAAWNYDRVLAEDTTQRISDRSESTMTFVRQFDDRKAMSDVLKKAISFFAWDNTTPIYGYDRFGEGGKETFRGIMKGDDQLTLNSKTIIEFTKSAFTGQEAEDWSKELHYLGIGGYQITTAQIMSLYCLNKRQAAKQHLYAAKDLYGNSLEGAVKNVYGEIIDGQGIVIGATKGHEKTVPIKVTKADVERITSMLTARQREVADKLQEFMGTVCADWGNYVTMRRFGIMQFGEDNYFPMQVFRENSPSLPQEIPQQASIFKLLNMGFTKSLNERGNGALELNSIFDVFIKHSSEMAAYNAFALPILDAYKWLSYKEEGADGIRSLKTVSRLAYGDDGIRFIMNHLEDLNGTSNTATSAEQIVKGLIRRYKTAATAANMRVVLMQPTSYLRAVNEIDSKYLRRAINLNPKALKATIDEMNEKSPLAMKKNGLGAFDVNVSRTVAEQALQTEDVKGAKGVFEKAMNISMIAASKADEITWATLYKAVQLETKEKYPELQGDAFDSYVNDRFRDICYRTQVFDSINARSNLMRKKDLFHQMLTAFGSEPTLSYSMLSNNVFLYAVEARNGQYQRAWNKYGKKIKHAFVAFMLSAIAVSAVAAVPDWLRDDEDDKNFIETYFKNFGMNILGEATGLLPYFRDIYSVVVEGYDPSRPDEEILKTARQAWSAMAKAVEDGKITYRTVYQAAKLFSQSTGLPVGNLVRDFKSLWNKTVGEVFGMKIK